MQFDLSHFSLSSLMPSIDIEDDRYRITIASPDVALSRSIEAVGLLHPPVLQKTAASHIVVSGFNRIKAVCALGLNGIDCLVLPEDTSPKACLLFAIADNISSRDLNILEQAVAVRKLSGLVPDKSMLYAMLAGIGLNLSPGLARKYERLLALPSEIQDAVGRGTMTLSAALLMENAGGDAAGDIDPRSVRLVCCLFERLRPGANRQKELLIHLKEIAVRRGVSISSVLESDEVSCILNSEEPDRKVLLLRLHKQLRKLRFPALCAMEADFAEYLSRLELPPDIRFVFPEGFEDTRYRFIMDVNSPSDFEKHAALMHMLSSHPAILEIFRRELRD